MFMIGVGVQSYAVTSFTIHSGLRVEALLEPLSAGLVYPVPSSRLQIYLDGWYP